MEKIRLNWKILFFFALLTGLLAFAEQSFADMTNPFLSTKSQSQLRDQFAGKGVDTQSLPQIKINTGGKKNPTINIPDVNIMPHHQLEVDEESAKKEKKSIDIKIKGKIDDTILIAVSADGNTTEKSVKNGSIVGECIVMYPKVLCEGDRDKEEEDRRKLVANLKQNVESLTADAKKKEAEVETLMEVRDFMLRKIDEMKQETLKLKSANTSLINKQSELIETVRIGDVSVDGDSVIWVQIGDHVVARSPISQFGSAKDGFFRDVNTGDAGEDGRYKERVVGNHKYTIFNIKQKEESQ